MRSNDFNGIYAMLFVNNECSIFKKRAFSKKIFLYSCRLKNFILLIKWD